MHKPGNLVGTLKAWALVRLSSFDYRITTKDWENLSALQERTLILRPASPLDICQCVVLRVGSGMECMRYDALHIFY